jgi:hypothetical protein
LRRALATVVVQMPQRKTEGQSEVRETRSFKVNPSLWKEFKHYAVDKDMDMSVLLEELIREKLKRERELDARKRP